jgi:hypothetical protein
MRDGILDVPTTIRARRFGPKRFKGTAVSFDRVSLSGCGSPLISRVMAAALLVCASMVLGQQVVPANAGPWPGLNYTNYRVASVPWSIHVVQVDRTRAQYAIHSVHAQGMAVGLGTLSAMIDSMKPAYGPPAAAVSGDFYQRDRAYAGLPRGLQIKDGEVLSAPSGSVSFWIDAQEQPHATNVQSLFRVTWPDSQETPFGLNGNRRANEIELYTPAIGTSTRTVGGRELLLTPEARTWLPLRMGRTYSARVREIRDRGNTPLEPDIMVLSLGPSVAPNFANIGPGAILRLTTASSPSLLGAVTAISGGPVLVRNGKPQRIRSADTDSYVFTSMSERHPRAAIGWNQRGFFLVEVDGRQRYLSVGMDLDELASFMAKLGCEEAMNLDGGGSATFWYNGRVRNSPCDGHERNIANALVVVTKTNRISFPDRHASSDGN